MRIIKWLAAGLVLVILVITAFIQFAPEAATHYAINSERARAGLTKHSVKLDDGLTYTYLEGGIGEPLLLLHGFTANKDNFTRIAAKLTDKYRVIIPDEIGFGESSHPERIDYRSDAQAERLHELMAKLSVKQLHIGGNSMGGAIAVAYAARFGADVESLWLMDPGGVTSAPQTQMFKDYQQTGKLALIAHTPQDFEMVYKLAMNSPPYVPTAMLHVFAKENIANAALEEQIFQQLASDSIEEHAKELKTPTLIVWGDHDQVLDVAGADILHKLMVNSQLIIMKDIGHMPMMEDVSQTAKDYLAFRTKLDRQ